MTELFSAIKAAPQKDLTEEGIEPNPGPVPFSVVYEPPYEADEEG